MISTVPRAVGRRKDDAGTPCELARRVAVGAQRFKLSRGRRGQGKSRCPARLIRPPCHGRAGLGILCQAWNTRAVHTKRPRESSSRFAVYCTTIAFPKSRMAKHDKVDSRSFCKRTRAKYSTAKVKSRSVKWVQSSYQIMIPQLRQFPNSALALPQLALISFVHPVHEPLLVGGPSRPLAWPKWPPFRQFAFVGVPARTSSSGPLFPSGKRCAPCHPRRPPTRNSDVFFLAIPPQT